MSYPPNRLSLVAAVAAIAVMSAAAVLLAACTAVPRPTAAPAPAPAPLPDLTTPPNNAPASVTAAAPSPAPQAAVAAVASRPPISNAATALAYRRDAASHLYSRNADRIYKGMLQPNLYAVGVLDVDIDRQGQITAISWRRAPSHVPEVMAEIVRLVRTAAPYPVPARMGRVTYTDIWLWDKSGQFQLDTLTEGQL